MAAPTATDELSATPSQQGQSPPLAVLTDTDKSGEVVITTSLCLIFSLFSMAIRIFVRQYFRRTQLGWDDVASISSMVTLAIQSAFVFVQVRNGFGKTIGDLSTADMVMWQQTAFACDILYIFILWLTKCSVAFLFIRLTPDSKHVIASYVFMGASTVVMVVSEFLIAIRCDESQPWRVVGVQCNDLFIRWQITLAFDVVTELLLFGISLYMLQGLTLKLTNKLIVLSAFALRLPIIIPATLRLHWLELELNSVDPTLDGVLASVFTQIQLSFAIFATTSPILRTFMNALNTQYGGPNHIRTAVSGGTNQPGKTTGESFSMSSPVSSTSQTERGPATKWAVPRTRWDNVKYSVQVTAPEKESQNLHSDDSRQRSIIKNTSWAVSHTLPKAAAIGGNIPGFFSSKTY